MAKAVLVAAALLLGAGVAFVAYKNLGAAPISAERATYENLPENRMRFAFDVSRAEPERAAVCVVRVRSIQGAETGRREVYVPPGRSPLRVETVITASAEPVTAEVFGCSYQVPEYLSTGERPSE
ncbi:MULTISPECIES: DUF4307 domain-containing protein [Actinokineospora]|uniref:DUF4307 domain-containing protein n=1 Tax=Actinokineospora TaxID=39845 RepID=UPI001E38F95A|nr:MULTISPECIES: DUF4307 domain-containing protein [Actinokineospora]